MSAILCNGRGGRTGETCRRRLLLCHNSINYVARIFFPLLQFCFIRASVFVFHFALTSQNLRSLPLVCSSLVSFFMLPYSVKLCCWRFFFAVNRNTAPYGCWFCVLSMQITRYSTELWNSLTQNEIRKNFILQEVMEAGLVIEFSFLIAFF